MSNSERLTPEQQALLDAVWEDACKRGLIQLRIGPEPRFSDIDRAPSEGDVMGRARRGRGGRGGGLSPGKFELAVKAVLAERERELLELKGPCSNKTCDLHYAHSGPCR